MPANHFYVCGCVRGFWSPIRRPQDDWSLFTDWQTGNTCMREGGAAGLMADSSALWSALHSLGTKNPLLDEKPPRTREEFGKWKLPSGGEDGGGWGVEGWWVFLMETSRWQGRGSGTYISICGLSVTPLFPLRLFTCVDHLQVTFAARHIFISDWPRLERQKACRRLHCSILFYF